MISKDKTYSTYVNYTKSSDLPSCLALKLIHLPKPPIKGLDTGKACPYLPGTIANAILKFTVMAPRIRGDRGCSV